MSPELQVLVRLLAFAGVAVGTAGLVLPIVPGPALIWASAVAWGWTDGFATVGWPTLIVMGLMAAVAEVADLLVTAWSARRGGVPWRSILAASLAGLAGGLVLSVPGAIAGGLGGLLFAEYQRHGGDWNKAVSSSRLVVTGYAIALVVQVLLGLGMVAIFFWQAVG